MIANSSQRTPVPEWKPIKGASRPKALRAGTASGHEQPPARHLLGATENSKPWDHLTLEPWGPPHPWALGVISLWTCPLAGDELGLSLLDVTCPWGYSTPKGLPLQFSRSMFTGHASHSLQGMCSLFCPCVPCSPDLGVCKTVGPT